MDRRRSDVQRAERPQTVDPAFDRGDSPRVAAGVVRFVGPHLGPVYNAKMRRMK